MDITELNTLLQRGVVRVAFAKKSDGSRREMRCTRHTDIMPPPPAPNPDKPTRPMPEGHLLVWDLEAEGLRSFDIATLLEEPVLLEDLSNGS